MRYEPTFHGHAWIGLYLAADMEEMAQRLHFYADCLEGKARLLREQMVLAAVPVSPCDWCDGRRIVEIGEDRVIACPMCASGIETEGHDRETGHGAKHESAAPEGDAQIPPQ